MNSDIHVGNRGSANDKSNGMDANANADND